MRSTVALLLASAISTVEAMRGGGGSMLPPSGEDPACMDISALFANVNALCCNGGRGGGHRRLQGNTEAPCVLSTCTPACAAAFTTMMDDCQPDLPVSGSAFSIIDQIPGADAFLDTCHAVLSPRSPGASMTQPGSWTRVSGQFMTADPGVDHGGGNSASTSLDTSGDGAREWGVWRTDPGNTGVRFSGIPQLEATGRAPRGWSFNPEEWWVEEHGMIMTNPDPLPEGRYKVVWLNRRAGYVPTVELTISGDSWTLSHGANLHDVTHGPCRSAKYTTPARGGHCVPDDIPQSRFPMPSGSVMPDVPGCDRVDYRVLFIDSIWQ